jgi:hypothetical protein
MICTATHYCAGDNIESEVGGACSAFWREESRVQDLLGKPETTGRPRRRWKDTIKVDLQEVGCGGKDWIELV